MLCSWFEKLDGHPIEVAEVAHPTTLRGTDRDTDRSIADRSGTTGNSVGPHSVDVLNLKTNVNVPLVDRVLIELSPVPVEVVHQLERRIATG